MRSRLFRRSFLRKFSKESEAASLAEYALLLGVAAVALLVVISQFSGSVSNLFARTTNTMSQVSSGDATSGSGDQGSGTETGTGTGTGTTGPGNSGSTPNGGGNGPGGGNNGNGGGNSGNNGGGNGGGKKP